MTIRSCVMVLAASVALHPSLAAQSPWTVSITPTMDPLPIGACVAVRLSVLDASGSDAPRSPNGARVTIADFDMRVSADDRNAVVGKQIDPYHWSVCACQSAAVGSTATITATYPAAALAEELRVPRVQIERSAPITIKSRMGDQEPAGCAKATSETRVAERVPLPPRAPVDASTPTIAKPGSGLPVETAPPSRGTHPVGIGAAAAAPGNVVASGVSPLVANITWSAVPNAVRYAVLRGTTGTVSVERTPASFTALQFRDAVPDPRPVYQYTVVAYYADGTSGAAPAVAFTSPAFVNPLGFTAKDRGLGNVDFSWQPVAGAVRYRLDGTGIPGVGFYTTTTNMQYPKIPAGPGSWKVTALYPGNYADYTTGTTTSTVVRVLPLHSKRWLTHRNGGGTLAQVQTPAYIPPPKCSEGGAVDPRSGSLNYGDETCRDAFNGLLYTPGRLANSYAPDSAQWLGDILKAKYDSTTGRVVVDSTGPSGLARFLGVELPLWNQPAQFASEAVYGNPLDLGVGRRAACAQQLNGPRGAGLRTVCYATAHGSVPGTAGFNDPNIINHPEEGVGSDFILSMVIIKEPIGTTFLVLSKAPRFTLLPTVTLDTEGPKLVPFACISCHGGTYNAITKRVDGSSFLPLDPGLLSFASASAQSE